MVRKNQHQRVYLHRMKEFLRFLFTRRFLLHLGAAVLLVVALFFLWIFSLNWYTHHNMSITVPDFKGKTVDEVLKLLEEKNLKYKIRDTVYFDDKRKGSILDQDPMPESHVKEGRIIYFTINGMTPPDIKFPDKESIEGSLRNAKAQLESRGFNVNAIYTSGPHRDYVYRAVYDGQDVVPGQLIPKGSTIDLYVESGMNNASISVPDLTGKSVSEALQIIKDNNLSLGSVKPADLENDPDAVVEKQIPAYDSTATMNQGDPIYIYLKRKDD